MTSFPLVHLQLPDYTISQVPVPLHCGINSLSHAYLNARAVVYGWTMCQLGVEKWDIYDLQYQKMLSEENARQFPKYLLSRTDSEDNSSDILQQNKTLVRTLLKEKVNQDKSLHEVKSIFLAKNISCDKVEELYVERKFVKYTFQRLLNQTQVYLTENADNISPVYIKSLFQGTSSLGEISPPLSSLPSFVALKEPLDAMQSGQKQFYLRKYLLHVKKCLKSVQIMNEAEIEFLQELSCCLIEMFITLDQFSIMTEQNDSEIVDSFLYELRNDCPKSLKNLKFLADGVTEKCSSAFTRNVATALKDWKCGRSAEISMSSTFTNRKVLCFLKDLCEHSYDVIPPTGERFSALSGLGIFTPFRCAHYWQQTLCDYNQVIAIPGLALLITKVLAGHHDLYIMILHNHMFFGAQ